MVRGVSLRVGFGEILVLAAELHDAVKTDELVLRPEMAAGHGLDDDQGGEDAIEDAHVVDGELVHVDDLRQRILHLRAQILDNLVAAHEDSQLVDLGHDVEDVVREGKLLADERVRVDDAEQRRERRGRTHALRDRDRLVERRTVAHERRICREDATIHTHRAAIGELECEVLLEFAVLPRPPFVVIDCRLRLLHSFHRRLRSRHRAPVRRALRKAPRLVQALSPVRRALRKAPRLQKRVDPVSIDSRSVIFCDRACGNCDGRPSRRD